MWRTEARALLGIAALAFASAVYAGNQQYEVLSASVRATLAKAVSDGGGNDLYDMDSRVWVRAMTARAQAKFPDEESARKFLAMVHYEALRSGLDPHLVLAVIDVESHFRRYAVSRSGARGFMQVMPFWIAQIGEPGQNLFHERTNLRYGCTILRHYLDRENGNVAKALARYNGSLGDASYAQRVMKAWRERWSLAL